MGEGREKGLGGVGDLAIHLIASKLAPKDVASLACVAVRFRVLASDESLWLNLCNNELQITSPQDHLGNPIPSFKETYVIWREAFPMYPWPLVQRVKRCWDRLKTWLAKHFPEARATLRKGASEDEIKELEKSLKVKLPLPTRVLYRFCDGQDLDGTSFGGSMIGSALGIIGGYSFYDHIVNVYLLPISDVIKQTKEFMRLLGFSTKCIIVATSSTYTEKLFFVDCKNGQLSVGTRNLLPDGEMMPCVPNALLESVHDINAAQLQDGMLLWLEEHGRRLQNGIVRLRDEGDFRSINLFPERSPACTAAVTNGVQVRASAVLVPEVCDLQNASQKYIFSYSIRMCLLPEGCKVNGMSFSSCQLYWRHWLIRANDNVIDNVDGEGVIGKFPILYPGDEDFIYESCTGLSSSGSIEGYFTFVPGRLAEPEGNQFQVAVVRIPLQVPDYIF